ncbi:hypothetical protein EYF80_045972 [Liparis tanakae]|uniref:Uncharacterized protein n=1 Tax=Liparis tanakae TaxID=230148 RepID=A0A4Z2FS64_9TELE|nr:hypothetical protein EYF80_045972 [Liparis tanakae]
MMACLFTRRRAPRATRAPFKQVAQRHRGIDEKEKKDIRRAQKHYTSVFSPSTALLYLKERP